MVTWSKQACLPANLTLWKKIFLEEYCCLAGSATYLSTALIYCCRQYDMQFWQYITKKNDLQRYFDAGERIMTPRMQTARRKNNLGSRARRRRNCFFIPFQVFAPLPGWCFLSCSAQGRSRLSSSYSASKMDGCEPETIAYDKTNLRQRVCYISGHFF